MRSPRSFLLLLSAHAFVLACPLMPAIAADTERVEPQPFFAQARRIIEAMDYLGSPINAADKAALEEAGRANDAGAVRKAEEIYRARLAECRD